MGNEKKIKFCSKCGSTNLGIVTTPWKARGGPISQEYKCEDCGVEMTAFDGDEEFLAEFRKKLAEKE